MMETAEDDGELGLVKASANLLSDLEIALPKLLWRPGGTPSARGGRVHSKVKQQDLDYVLQLVRQSGMCCETTLMVLDRSSHSKANHSCLTPG